MAQGRFHKRMPSAVSSSSFWNTGQRAFQDDNSNNSQAPKFLTSEDLDQTQRAYYSEWNNYEDENDDLDRMAANYNPQEENDEFDVTLLRERDSTLDRSEQRPMPKTNDMRSQWTRSNKENGPLNIDEMDNPRSPISFISIIADPSPVNDDASKRQKIFPTRQTTSIPTSNQEQSGMNTLDVDFPGSSSQISTTEEQPDGDFFPSSFTSKESSMSAEAFRAKYTFDELPVKESHDSSIFVENETDDPSSQTVIMPPAMMETSRRKDVLYQLELDIKRLDKEITTVNNGRPLNLGSYKQVSQALFGTPDQSVSKSVLEGMAFSSILAKLILEYRDVKQRHKKIKQQEDRSKTKQEERRTVSSSSTSSSIRSNDDDEPLILVDTSSFIFRAYYSMPPMHRKDGLPISAVLGFCNMLNRMVMTPLLNGKQPRLVLCCDAPSPASGGPKTIRHELYDQYKANRPEAPMDLIPQFPLFRLAAQAYGMLWIEAPGYEADDVIASLSRMALEEGLSVHIYSGDKDLMQLVTNSSTTEGLVKMIDPMTMTHWEHGAVVEKWGVAAHQLGDVLALAGDSADNIPGVPGIGPKIAAQLLQQFGTLEELLANLDQVRQTKRRETLETYRDQAILSQQLVKLIRDLGWEAMTIDPLTDEHPFFPPPERVGDLRMAPIDADRILQFYEAMEFRTIKEKLLERLQRQSKIRYSYQSSTTAPSKKISKAASFGRERVKVPNPEDFDSVPF
jgi:5'-3' exonuclease